MESEGGVPRLLSAKELAEALGVSVRTIWRLTASGDLPAPVRIGGGRVVRWPAAVVKSLVAGAGGGR